ncbi:uncharacterized protein TRIADDRAFT_26121 [Trichoplax adhaerens]|uniref:Exonuclease 1 n=1 Tax=Trichoplax adhaerens TaxID=10228 RepID=B3S0T1_TRIAD|nr:hypothetical protein TRIADDRAFT_26121 [Trichoplax adhaerens]EDV24061.1 hypothetical protein TRIADDRAFT_26121 [Trichoplax adhaerens]|eukprot:XP_002113587.1 hypothetical protein TRIADDRAFT_26121 [Trichoplax adhaerens]
MGIQGLLPLLKAIQRPARIEEFAGCTVAVDSYCWLHRGVYGCSKEIIEGKATRMYVNYCMKRIEMLINFNVKPIMVFDGGHLPSKMQKEEERKLNRQFNKSKGIEYLRQDKYIDALDCFRRAVDITPAMALELIKARLELIQNLKDIECIVAPYEADAQLAYLSKADLVDAVITEDSDLLVFGCKKVLFKLDPNGRGIEIRLDRLREVKDIDLNGVDHEAFRHICILSGCDYLPSIPGMGLKTAYKIMKRNRMKVYSAIKYIRRQNTMKVPKNYETQFKMADETFLYQVVFDPVTKTTIPLTPYPKDIEPSTLEHAGQYPSLRKNP